MAGQEGDQVAEHVQAQAQVWNYMYGFAQSAALRCAAELGIAEIINKQPNHTITLSQLAAALPIPSLNKYRLYRIMRFMVHMKLFTLQVANGEGEGDKEEKYGLAPAAKLLLSDNPKSMLSLVAFFGELSKPLAHLSSALEGNSSVFEKLNGMTVWQFWAGDPEKYKEFDAAMAGETKNFMPVLIRGCQHVFKGIRSLVDVGGGSGTSVTVIAKTFYHLKCTLYDLPHVIEAAPRNPLVDVIPGDMFKFVPKADAILLKSVLHDWDDEECVKILKRCKEAIVERGGKVIIVDAVIDWGPEHVFSNTKHLWDLQIMVTSAGKERSENEFKQLLESAGFSRYEIMGLQSVYSVIVAYP